MRFRLSMSAVGLGLAAMISMNAYGQIGPPGSSYVTEAARYPDAASKPTPHLADGHPDLNGVWHHYFGGLVSKVGDKSFALDFGKAFGAGANGPRPTPDPAPEYKSQYVAKVQHLNDNQVKEDSTLHCRPPGIPRLGPPQQIVMTPKQAVFLYADITGNQWRVVPLDGRGHSTDPETDGTSNGDSVGRWEGDTLVVDVTRLSDDTWLGDNGLFHSSKLHVTERLKRVGDTIHYQMIAEDPQVLEKPWTLTRTLTLQPDTLQEAAACVDNDAGHYVNQEHHDNSR